MINNTTVENKYTTTDTIDTVYPITFDGATDAGGSPLLKVTITDTEEAVQNLVYNIDYVLVYDDNQEDNDESLNEPHLNGIKLIRAELAIAGNSLTITRNTPFVQPIDFQIGRIDPEQVERVADLSVLRDQELRNQMAKDEAVIEDHEERITTAETTIADHEERLDTAEGTIADHEERITTAEGDITTLYGHKNDLNNPHQTSISKLTDTDITSPVNGQFMMFDGLKWKNVFSSVAMFWGDMQGDISDQTDLVAEFAKKVNKSGDTMTGDLSFQYNANNPVLRIIQSGQNTNHLRFINNNSASQSISFDLTQAAIHPLVTGRGHLGTSSIHFGDAYVDTIYTGIINNGYDITVPVTAAADSFALESEITDINGKIPAQASTSNQLADKNFVNSSIATNTANFIGTFNSVADLEAYSGTVTNNDYAFVVSTDSAGNTTYNRYKYTTATTPASWVYEYTLNNSSFTSDQWAAINSGVTSSDVSKARTAVQPSDLGNGTITINQGGTTKGTFTTNQGGNTTIDLDAGGTGGYHPDLFDVKWADHILNDMQWLRGDTFSWQDGTVYEAALRHLWNDITKYKQWENGGSYIYTQKRFPDVGDKAYSDNTLTTEVGTVTNVDIPDYMTLGTITVNGVVYTATFNSLNIPSTTETVAGTTITFRLAPDGHKIVPADQESNVTAIYNATGVAWYYIFDVEYYRFKLPRTQFGFTGIRNGVGNFVEAGLPEIGEIQHVMFANSSQTNNNAITYNDEGRIALASGGGTEWIRTVEIGSGNNLYGNSATVQPKATEMYLYFYVGNFTQTAIENTAGLNAELFNNKVDTGHEVIEFQAPTEDNDYTWFRLYADGWVEQGGIWTGTLSATKGNDATSTQNLPVTMADTNYCVNITNNGGTTNPTVWEMWCVESLTTTQFRIHMGAYDNTRTITRMSWEVKGMAAS